jgi:hypothetical protein
VLLKYQLEKSDIIGLWRLKSGQKLQRDRLIQFQVFGFIDFAHAAAAQQAGDAITLIQYSSC